MEWSFETDICCCRLWERYGIELDDENSNLLNFLYSPACCWSEDWRNHLFTPSASRSLLGRLLERKSGYMDLWMFGSDILLHKHVSLICARQSMKLLLEKLFFDTGPIQCTSWMKWNPCSTTCCASQAKTSTPSNWWLIRRPRHTLIQRVSTEIPWFTIPDDFAQVISGKGRTFSTILLNCLLGIAKCGRRRKTWYPPLLSFRSA